MVMILISIAPKLSNIDVNKNNDSIISIDNKINNKVILTLLLLAAQVIL